MPSPRACDRGETTREDAAGAILYAAERATWMALETIQCLGGNGYINDYPAGRLLRDAKLYEIGAGTSEIRRMLIGREIFRKDAVVRLSPSRRSNSSTALSKTCAPAAHSSKLVDSASLCEMPPAQGTKIMVVGATRAI